MAHSDADLADRLATEADEAPDRAALAALVGESRTYSPPRALSR